MIKLIWSRRPHYELDYELIETQHLTAGEAAAYFDSVRAGVEEFQGLGQDYFPDAVEWKSNTDTLLEFALVPARDVKMFHKYEIVADED